MKIIFIIIAVVVVRHYLFPLIQVIGDSMHPTYLNGDIIIGYRFFRKSKLKVGQVILYECPTDGLTVIKRIAEIKVYEGKRYFYCLGDNPDNSNDSRNYGYVSSKNLICKVVNQRENQRR